MAALVLLNGLPGLGKSSVAALLADDLDLVVVDPDELRTRWTDPGAARAQAFSLIAARLAAGRDVVVPQLVAQVAQLGGFELVATAAGAAFRHVLLVDDGEDPVARSLRSTAGGVHAARADLDEHLLRSYAAGLEEVRAARPGTLVVATAEGDPAATREGVLRALVGVLPGRRT